MPKHKQHAEKTVTVDGLEGDLARIEHESGETSDIALADLPAGVKEGDILREVDGKLEINHAETGRRSEKAQAKLDALNTTQAQEIDL